MEQRDNEATRQYDIHVSIPVSWTLAFAVCLNLGLGGAWSGLRSCLREWVKLSDAEWSNVKQRESEAVWSEVKQIVKQLEWSSVKETKWVKQSEGKWSMMKQK